MPFNIGKLRYWKGRKLSASHKLKIRRAMAKPEVRKKLSEGIKRAYSEGKLKKIWKGRHLPLAMREKISETKKKQAGTPGYRKKTSRFFKKYWKEHPEKHKQVLDKTINLWKKDKRKREEISKIAKKTLLNRWGGAESTAEAVVYCVKNKFSTGAIILNNGGAHLRY